jgi:hypothetical protein
MMRAATVLILMFSTLAAPVASAVCTDCCHGSVQHRHPLSHNQARAHPASHLHHMSHEHMVVADLESRVVTRPCDHQFREDRLRCHNAACLSARPVQTSAFSAPSNQQQIPAQLLASAICSSLPTAAPGRPPDGFRTNISSSPSAFVSLRI